MYRKSIPFQIFIILHFIAISTRAQQNDFQIWPSVQLNLEVFKNLRFHLEEEVRFIENVSLTGRQLNDLGISYRLNKTLKAGFFYRLEADLKNYDEFVWRNGVYSDISLRHEIGRFTIGYRLRVQSSKVERNSEENLFNGFRHRHRLSVAYDIKGIPLVPFADAELFVDYSRANRSTIKGLRNWIGLEYSIEKIHKISLKYGIDQEFHTSDPIRSYITSVGYTLNLSLVSDK